MDPAPFPAAAAPAPAPAALPPSPDFDSLGRPFDPVKFRRDKDTLGRWKNARAGRKTPGAASSPASAAAAPTSTPRDPAPADFSDVERAAGSAEGKAVLLDDNATADTVIGVIQTALVLIGDEEGVLSETEKTLLRRPLVRVLEKYNVGADVMPAEVDLCLALAGLLITRLQKPKTATWFAKVKAWAVNLWFRGKGHALARDLRQHVGPISPPTSTPAP